METPMESKTATCWLIPDGTDTDALMEYGKVKELLDNT